MDVGSTVTVGSAAGADLVSTLTVGEVVTFGVVSIVTMGATVGADFDSALTVGVMAVVGLGTTASVGAAIGVGVRSTAGVGIGACWCSAAGVYSISGSEVRAAMAIRIATAPPKRATAATTIDDLASLRSFNSDLPVFQAVKSPPLI